VKLTLLATAKGKIATAPTTDVQPDGTFLTHACVQVAAGPRFEDARFVHVFATGDLATALMFMTVGAEVVLAGAGVPVRVDYPNGQYADLRIALSNITHTTPPKPAPMPPVVREQVIERDPKSLEVKRVVTTIRREAPAR
jgi:hypothetical protein